MTEQEIVEYLKGNKTKGVAFGFMPDEVQKWCNNNKTKLKFFDGYATLRGWRDYNNPNIDIHFLDILRLPEDFKMEEKTEGRWVEFEIDDDGDFCYTVESEKGGSYKTYYPWYSWQKFLEETAEDGNTFTAFGGWQYPNSSYWSTYPQVKTGRGDNYSSYYCEKEQGEDYPAYPAIPVKIRFWTETK